MALSSSLTIENSAMEFLLEHTNAGQINLDSTLGNIIHSLASIENVKTIVEIGTWNGLGSTMCVIKAILDKGKQFISIELYPAMYQHAVANLALYHKYVRLLNGSIVTIDDISPADLDMIRRAIASNEGPAEINIEHAKQWFNSDLQKLKEAKNVLCEIPSQIDLLILDGGEYTTYAEWLKLRDRTRIFVLDDTNLFKCKRIREEMLASEKYRLLVEDRNDRNGYAVFERI